MKKYKNNYRAWLSLWLLLLCASTALAQTTKSTGSFWNKTLEQIASPASDANWIELRTDANINPERFFIDYSSALGLGKDDEMRLYKVKTDNLGFTHYGFNQYYKNVKVVFGEFKLHQRSDGFVQSANGRIITGINSTNVPTVTEAQAFQKALQYVNAKKYLWQNESAQAELKLTENNPNATYLPVGELGFSPSNFAATYLARDYRLTWSFKIYVDDINAEAKTVYVDALTGNVVYHTPLSMICDAGTGTSAFNGSVFLSTDLFGGSYRSHNDCQATDIRVYNCAGGGQVNNYYTDADNTWTGQSATQCQWGVVQTYNYFNNVHSRQSWDGTAGDLIAYNNALAGENNACWGCTGNSAIFYAGSTSAPTDDWNTNDIIGHEFGHGVVQDEAGLVYSYESGALNESFADIFGDMVESWSEGSNDWLVGADRGAIRSFSNPNAYGHPDTYLGTNWYSGSDDNGGVHTNSGVQNYWFYLLSTGGSGTNDFGNSFNVTGITSVKAEQIAYRALTQYLNSSSGYSDARTASVHAARDIYGSCSNEAYQTAKAWYAVGVGGDPWSNYDMTTSSPLPNGSVYYYDAVNSLTSTSTISSGAQPTYLTSAEIILQPGFTVNPGADFSAYVTPCTSSIPPRLGYGNSQEPENGNSKMEIDNINVYPNPFNNNFNLEINLTEDANVSITIYDMLGKEVDRVIQNQSKQNGLVQLQYNNEKLQPNIYMCVIEINGKRYTKKIIKM